MKTERLVKHLNDLDENARPLFETLIDKCHDQGLNAQISCSYRSFTEQDKLYQQGRTLTGKKISNAKAGMSMHNYKLACDFFIQDGSKAIFERKYYQQMWDICLELGLDKKGMRWGGNFKSFKDSPHFEVSYGANWREIAVLYGVSVADIEAGDWKKYESFL